MSCVLMVGPEPMAFEVAAGRVVTGLIGAELVCDGDGLQWGGIWLPSAADLALPQHAPRVVFTDGLPVRRDGIFLIGHGKAEALDRRRRCGRPVFRA